MSSESITTVSHPLDPLSADEISRAAGILRRDQGVGERWRFASIELREPPKQTVREYTDDDPIDREADGEQGQQRLGQGEKQHS